MELSCELLNKLCAFLDNSKVDGHQETHILYIFEELLDLVANYVATEGSSDKQENAMPAGIQPENVQLVSVEPGNRHSADVQPVDVQSGTVGLVKSRLYSNSVENDTDTKGSTYLEKIDFTSETLYLKRLLDVTPTDERLLGNPKRVAQIGNEIDGISRQKWQCLRDHWSFRTSVPGNVCPYMKDHVACIVKVFCDGLLSGPWTEVFSEVLHYIDANGVEEAGTACKHARKIHHLGVKLYNTLAKFRAFCDTSDVDDDTILQHVDQVISQMPTWTKVLSYEGSRTDSDFGVCVARLCRYLGDLAEESHDSSSEVAAEMTGLSWKSGRGICLKGMIRRVDERLHEYEDCFMQMLSQPNLWEAEEWIACLERNSTALGIPSTCKQLCDVIMTMKVQSSNSPKLNRLLKVFLSSCATLSPLTQNQICEDIWSHPLGHSLFSNYDKTGFHQEMTTAFNRLVNVSTAEGLEEIIDRIFQVSLQSPTDTLHEAVQRAVSNSASTQSILKILQILPALASFKPPGDNSQLLVQILMDIIDVCDDMSSSEEANVIHVISQLLQPFKLHPDCPYQEKSLLSHTLVMKSCILPYLHSGVMGNHDNHSSTTRLGLCVKLLEVTLNSFKSKVQTSPPYSAWIPEISPFPIILCLCDLLDQSFALWDVDSPSYLTPDSKELVTDILSDITSTIHSSHRQDETFDGCLQWLLDRVSALHWTVQLQLGICLQDFLPGHKKVVPACLFEICDLSSESWVAIPSSTSDLSTLHDQLVTFLQCCRVSSQMSSDLCQVLKPEANLSRLDFFQAMLFAMTTVLPQSSLGEIARIGTVMRLLVEENRLFVPFSSQFMTCLPMFSYLDNRVALCLFQLYTSLVTLLASVCCEDWVSTPLWAHTIRGVVICIKDVVSDITTNAKEHPSAPGLVFALSQVMCHTCYMITLSPSEGSDQLFVLALDLMGMIDEVLAGDKGQESFDWSNERRAVEMVIAELADEEQRKTLMQKLSSLK